MHSIISRNCASTLLHRLGIFICGFHFKGLVLLTTFYHVRVKIKQDKILLGQLGILWCLICGYIIYTELYGVVSPERFSPLLSGHFMNATVN